jgi:transcriptional regulator NrdR family protein
MIKLVIKRDGSKVAFDAEKMKRAIASAALQANFPQDKRIDLVESITIKVIAGFEGKEEVKTTDIRDAILRELDAVAPTVAMTWRNYDANKK